MLIHPRGFGVGCVTSWKQANWDAPGWGRIFRTGGLTVVGLHFQAFS